MSRNYFVLLAMSILSLRYCETKNVVFGSNDGSHSDEADHFTGGKLLKKVKSETGEGASMHSKH
jgi:hypothetical protein